MSGKTNPIIVAMGMAVLKAACNKRAVTSTRCEIPLDQCRGCTERLFIHEEARRIFKERADGVLDVPDEDFIVLHRARVEARMAARELQKFETGLRAAGKLKDGKGEGAPTPTVPDGNDVV